MAITIKFDTENLPEKPTFVLATPDGRKLGMLNTATNFVVHDCLTSAAEFSLTVHKTLDDMDCPLWDSIQTLMLVWCREWDKWFQIDIDTEESNETVKHLTGTGLGEAELSQLYLYDIEINTETDILNDDYTVTVLYDADNPKGSLLDRIMEKAPHYTVRHVDSTIANVQRSFSFDETTIYDAFQEIADEIGCLFILDNDSDDETGLPSRTISVYDLQTACMNDECDYYQEHGVRYRGSFSDVCPKCGSANILTGYGEDTTIFVSEDNLTDTITKTPDTGSIKNCLRLVGGDDLMTAAIISCNPNGSQYIWNISDSMRASMSTELQAALAAYDELYYEYRYTKEIEVSPNYITAYNDLVAKYQVYDSGISELPELATGFAGLMEAYYDTIDFNGYLQSELMPEVTISETTAKEQCALLEDSSLSPVSLTSLTTGTSQATVESAIKLMVKATVNATLYSYEINTTSWTNAVSSDGTSTWVGTITLTSETDETDTATTSELTIVIDDDYENYIVQLVEKKNTGYNTDELTISDLFALDLDDFKAALQEYSLDYLESILDCCQGVIDVLIDYGCGEVEHELYSTLYYPYYQKITAINEEMDLRSAELDIIANVQDEIMVARDAIMAELDFEENLGETLWTELCMYRREDKYENDNYISDGLTNDELFTNAMQFFERAEEALYESSQTQHSISTTLRNLLVIPGFQKIVDYFCVGNWIRVMIDGELYRLRLVEYEIDYDDLTTLIVEFSDVELIKGGSSDLASLMSSMKSIASSYSSLSHQVESNSKNSLYVSGWVKEGLDVTNVNLVNSTDDQVQTWDEHGLLLRKYNAITDDYDDQQMKLVHRGLYITDDNWETVKTAVGNYYYTDPKTGKLTSAYGVMAETLVGELILGESLGIYNTGGSLTFDTDGLTITNGTNTFTLNPNSEQLLILSDSEQNIFYVDTSGNLILSGVISAASGSSFGAWSVTDEAIYRTSSTFADSDGMYFGDYGLSITNLFTVTADGALTSTSGIIGNWNITHYNLYSQFSTQEVTYEQVAQTDSDGNYIYTTEYVYDDDGNLVPETDEDGNIVYTTEYVYDDNGDPVYETDEDGNIVYTTEYVYDDNGNPVYKYEYDEDGNVVYGDDGEPVYATDSSGNYIQQTQTVAVQQTQEVISYQTQEVIVYETVEVVLDTYYDNYTSLNTSGSDSDIAISVGASEVDEDGIPVSSTGLIKLYNDGKLQTKSLYVEYEDVDAEPAIFFKRYRSSGTVTQVKIHSGNSDTPFVAFGFWNDISNGGTGTYTLCVSAAGIYPYATGTYYCGNYGKQWSHVYTKQLNVTSSCYLPCTVNMTDADGHNRTVIRLYGDGGSNYGSNLVITGNGNTLIGAGESAYNLYHAAYYNVDSEWLALSADNGIRFYTNCQAISSRKWAVLDSSLRFYPSTTNTGYLGTNSYRWGYLYAKNVYRVSESSLSDRKAKQNITNLTDDYQDFIMGLQPVSFDFIEGDSHRKHLGFIAQDVRDTAMETVGDLALFKASVVGHEDLNYNSKLPDEKLNWSLSYSEIIAPLVLLVQSQQKQIEEMQAQLAQLVSQ